jgi:hypothetical protein
MMNSVNDKERKNRRDEPRPRSRRWNISTATYIMDRTKKTCTNCPKLLQLKMMKRKKMEKKRQKKPEFQALSDIMTKKKKRNNKRKGTKNSQYKPF